MKFRMMIAAGCLLLATQTQAGALPPVTDQDAVAYQINIAHTGTINFTKGFKAPLRRVWSMDMGSRISYPLIADGMIFVTIAGSSDYGTELYALNLRKGTVLWHQDIDGLYNWSNAAYDSGRVFVVNVDGVLRAFNAKNGTLLWSTNLPDEGAFSSPPVAYNGTVYLPGAGESGRLYAVNEIDGSLRWEKPMQAGQNSSPAIGDNGIFLSFSCIYYKFDLKTGHPDWTVGQSCGGGGRTPVYADGRVWERDLFANYAIRASQTGRYLGTFDSDPAPAVYTDANNVTHQVAVINDVSTTSTNVATGAVEWTFTGDGEVDTAPLVINGNVVVGSATGMLYLLDGKTGATLWSENVGDPIGNPDESDLSQPLNGLGAGLGFLVVCSLSKVTVYAPHP